MAVSPHVQRIRENKDNIKKGHKYYRNKSNGFGKSIHLSYGAQRATNPTKEAMYQPDTRVFTGIKESLENIEAFIASKGIKKFTGKKKFTVVHQ